MDLYLIQKLFCYVRHASDAIVLCTHYNMLSGRAPPLQPSFHCCWAKHFCTAGWYCCCSTQNVSYHVYIAPLTHNPFCLLQLFGINCKLLLLGVKMFRLTLCCDCRCETDAQSSTGQQDAESAFTRPGPAAAEQACKAAPE